MTRVKKATKSTLALDLGSITGWAMSNSQGVTSGTFNLKEKGKFSRYGFNKLFNLLVDKLEDDFDAVTSNIDLVIELPHAGRFLAPLRILFGLVAVVQMFAEGHSIPLHEYRPKAIKKFATGNGNADKKMMVAAIQKQYPKVTDNNEADALALLHLHLGTK